MIKGTLCNITAYFGFVPERLGRPGAGQSYMSMASYRCTDIPSEGDLGLHPIVLHVHYPNASVCC